MKTYKIKYTAIFKGEIEVIAESKDEAKHIVKNGFGGLIAEVGQSSWLSNGNKESGIKDWDFPFHPEIQKIN